MINDASDFNCIALVYSYSRAVIKHSSFTTFPRPKLINTGFCKINDFKTHFYQHNFFTSKQHYFTLLHFDKTASVNKCFVSGVLGRKLQM